MKSPTTSILGRAAGVLACGVLLAATLTASACSDEAFETEHPMVQAGNEALVGGEAAEAMGHYEEAAAELPASPELSYVTGLAKSAQGEHHQGTQALIRALGTKDDELLQRVRAGLGLAYGRWALQKEAAERTPDALPGTGSGSTPNPAAAGANAPEPKDPKAESDEDAPPDWKAIDLWEKSVDQLERALLMDPADVESMRNLEVALLRVDPPCSARDDKYEPNGTPDKASPIKVGVAEADAPAQSGAPAAPEPAADKADELEWKGEGLLSCPDDVDYYRIELSAGDRLAVDLKAEGKADAGRLGVVLLDGTGRNQLRPPAGGGDPLTAFDYSVGQAAGSYLIRVDNIDGDELPYTLTVKVRPPCSKTEDRFEENDGADAAQLLTPGAVEGLKLCPLDEDWYRVTLGEGESLMVTVALEGEGAKDVAKSTGPPFTLDVASIDGTVKATGAAFNRTRVVTLFTPGVGDFTIRVAGLPALEERYTLNVRVVPPCDQGGDDEYEDNDIVEDATDVAAVLEKEAAAAGGKPPKGPASLSMRICQGDVDWFKITAKPDEQMQISAVFEHAKGDLALRLYSADGTDEVAVSDTSSETQNGEALVIPKVTEETTYTLKVEGGAGVENFYQLMISQPQSNEGDDKDDKKDDDKKDEEKDDKDEEKDDKKDDQKKDDKDDQKKDDQKKDQPEKGQKKPKPSRPLDDKLDKLDHNPENLEAEKARRSSPLANHPPDKDW